MNTNTRDTATAPVVTPSSLISLREACRLLPSKRRGKRLNLGTLFRWIFDGRLPAVKRGELWYVRPEDLYALNAPRPAHVDGA